MWIEIIEKFLSYSSVLVSIAALYIAWQGLNVWKKQLKGNAEYEVARKIMLLIYKIRRGVEVVRNPFMSVYEMYDFDFPDGLTDEKKEEMGIRKAFVKRYELLNKSRDQILVDVLEGEVLWGKEIRKIVYEYLGSVKKLDLAVSDYLQMRSKNGHFKLDEDYAKERQKEVHEIIYDLSPNSIDINLDDKFAIEISDKITEIELFLKNHLHK